MGLTVHWVEILIVALFSLPIGLLAAFYPETFSGITLGVFWGVLLIDALLHSMRRSVPEKWLRQVVVLGLLFRVPSSLAHLVLGLWIYSGGVDFLGYFQYAVLTARELLSGSVERMSFESGYMLHVFGTQLISRIASLGYFLVGPSIAGFFLLSGMIGFIGSYLFLRAFQFQYPSCREMRFLALCLFFFPSLAFWTSLLGKESWIFFFLGCATYSVSRMTTSFRARYWLLLILSIVLVFFIRAPVGIALAAAVASFFILSLPPLRGQAVILRPVAYMSCIIVAVGCLAILALLLRQYLGSYAEGSSLVEGLARFAVSRHVGLSTDPSGGGSSLGIVIREPTLSALLQYLPLGIITFLFRPFLYEARKVIELIAAVDGTMLLVLVIWRWRHLLAAIRSVLSKPFVAFCSVAFILFTVTLSVEANLGVIVRHRSMVLAFLFILLAIPCSQMHYGGRPARPSNAVKENR